MSFLPREFEHATFLFLAQRVLYTFYEVVFFVVQVVLVLTLQATSIDTF